MPNDLDAVLPALLEEIRLAYDAEAPDWMALGDAKRAWTHGDVEAIEAFLLRLVGDARWEARAAVAEVLRYLVGPGPREPGPQPVSRALEHACVLVAMAQTETDARVRVAILGAFVDLKNDVGDALTAAFVCRFAGDSDARAREAVAAALGANVCAQAIATLIALTRDDDAHVRDGACFALGHLLGSPGLPEGILDSDAIREALAARLDDPNDEVREEAATGLALRGDARGIDRMEALLAAFDAHGVTERVLMTASEAPSPRYVAALEAIVRECPELRSAVDALDACRAVRARPTCVRLGTSGVGVLPG
jgi:HEAT repeat protein